jgi:hypothetical protein
LANVLAQQRAKEMLASSDDYFPASDEAATGE